MKPLRLEWLFLGACAAALGAGGIAWVGRSRRRRDPEGIERQRREHVNRIGRIVEARILDVVETDAELPPAPRPSTVLASVRAPARPRPTRRWVVYGYSISGVVYEAAQDISGFAPAARPPTVGQVVSAKYDPADPANSILMAENWSGLE